jgi:hypothetical protein
MRQRLGLDRRKPREIVADADDLAGAIDDGVEMLHRMRPLLHGNGLMRYMRTAKIARQPFLAGEDPYADPLRVEKSHDLARDIARNAALVQDLQRRRSDCTAIKSGHRRGYGERLDQHSQSERRTAANHCEADVLRLKRRHGGARAFSHALLRRHERAVHIRDHQRDASHSVS